MDKELIQRLARESGLFEQFSADAEDGEGDEELLLFASLIAEECAKACESYVWYEDRDRSPDESNIGCAEAIRAKFATKA